MSTKYKASREHRDIARDAGFGSVSIVSVVAGTVTAYGTFAVVAAVVGAALNGADVNTNFRTNDWTGSGAVAALASAATLLVAYLFGGYVAGRMARRAAVLHGIAVFVLSLVAGAAVGGVVRLLADSADVERNLRSIGVPTAGNQLSDVAIAGAIVSLAAILVGAVVGAMLGERWHTKLARRAADPAYGPEVEAHRRSELAATERSGRVERDEAIRRDVVAKGDVHSQGDPVSADVDRRDDRRDRSREDEPRYTAEEWARLQDTHPRPF